MKATKRVLAILVSFSLLFGFMPQSANSAPVCPPSKVDGKTIGKIQVDGTEVNIKEVSYPKGGTVLPPRSPLNAGLSSRHMPLSADLGTSFLTWHVNFNKCQGKLNVINDKEIGFEFSVIDEKGETDLYRITERFTVKKGDYDADWFSLSGPRKLLLVSCTGKIVKGSYLKNLVIFAEPVNP